MRVLCDCITPYKQYMTEIIENVVDGISTPEDLTTENYPCEMTMDRWKGLIVGNRVQIDGALRSVGSRYLDFGVELLESKVSLLDTLRVEGAGWLAIVNRIMWNFRLTFLNARQLKDVPPGLSGVPEDAGLSSPHKEMIDHEKQGNTELAGRGSTQTLPDDQPADCRRTGSGEEDRSP